MNNEIKTTKVVIDKQPNLDVGELINCYNESQERINKAIEYVEEHRIKNPYNYECNCFMGNTRASDLLKILKGEENE